MLERSCKATREMSWAIVKFGLGLQEQTTPSDPPASRECVHSCICLLFLLILTPSSMLPLRRQWLAAFHLSNPSFLSVCHHPPSLIFFIAHRSSLVVVIHPTPGQSSLILPSSRPLSCISRLSPYEAKSLPYLVGLHTFNSGDLSLDPIQRYLVS